jgi:outer membrane immunogenic protein
MNKLTLVVAAAALTFTYKAAVAADLGHSAGGYKDEPAPSASATPWTGVYLGLGFGGGAANVQEADKTNGVTNGSTDLGAMGVFGTVQAGADYRFSGTRFVVGAFGDYDFGDVSGKDEGVGWSREWMVQDQWTIGGRLGALATPDTLLYGLVGYTSATQKVDLEGIGNTFWDGTTSKSVTTGGFTVGAGVETRLMGNWFLKGEYRYTAFDEGTLDARGNWSNTLTTDVQSVRSVLTYKLGAERYESFK